MGNQLISDEKSGVGTGRKRGKEGNERGREEYRQRIDYLFFFMKRPLDFLGGSSFVGF